MCVIKDHISPSCLAQQLLRELELADCISDISLVFYRMGSGLETEPIDCHRYFIIKLKVDARFGRFVLSSQCR